MYTFFEKAANIVFFLDNIKQILVDICLIFMKHWNNFGNISKEKGDKYLKEIWKKFQ